MHADERGTIWIATDRSVERMPAGTTTVSRRCPPTRCTPSIYRIGLCRRGLALRRGSGAAALESRRGQPVSLPADIGDARIRVLYTDRSGRLWAALADGRVAIRDRSGNFAVFGPADGLGAGTCRQIFEDDEGAIWLAAMGGLSKYRERPVRDCPIGSRLPCQRPHGHHRRRRAHAVDRHGLRPAARGEARLRRGGGRPLGGHPLQLYDRSDGLAGLPHAYNNNRRVVRASDGRLWFVTSRGLSVVDPRAFRDAAGAPPDHGRVRHGRRVADEGGDRSSSAGAHDAARDRLLGAEPELAAARRASAIGSKGSTPTGSTPARAAPRSTPTCRRGHTRSGCSPARPTARGSNPGPRCDVLDRADVLPDQLVHGRRGPRLLALGVWGIWQLRLRKIRRQFALLLGERVRLSRELHDTLLQGLVGVALQFDAIAADVETNAPAMQRNFVRHAQAGRGIHSRGAAVDLAICARRTRAAATWCPRCASGRARRRPIMRCGSSSRSPESRARVRGRSRTSCSGSGRRR